MEGHSVPHVNAKSRLNLNIHMCMEVEWPIVCSCGMDPAGLVHAVISQMQLVMSLSKSNSAGPY